MHIKYIWCMTRYVEPVRGVVLGAGFIGMLLAAVALIVIMIALAFYKTSYPTNSKLLFLYIRVHVPFLLLSRHYDD